MIKAAGILFLTDQNHALFLRRSPMALDFAGHWDFPGGAQEGDEDAEETALREAREEIGAIPAGVQVPHTRTKGSASILPGVAGVGAPPVLPVPDGAPAAAPANDVDYMTFLQRVGEQFIPKLSKEHDGWAWAPVDSPPQPLHPGCAIALERLAMDELGVARAIAAGRLVSPQRYENVWLFAIRITGTDVAFRDKIDEYVVRKPEHYLNDEFLARCNGLPVIFKHPKKSILDSDEFSNRIVGTVFLPYIAGDEVWAVAKIYVDAVAQMMREGDLSTSPSVNFADFSVNAKLKLEDGSKVLIEGKPSLFDHVAICELGVWDKGGEPQGIRSEAREDSAMADEDKKAVEDKAKDDAAKKDAFPEDLEKGKADAKRDDAKRADDDKDKNKKEEPRGDADAGHALDKTLSHIADSMKSLADNVAGLGKRMDAVEEREKGRDDKKRDDAKRKDADEPEKKDEPKELAAADKSKKDAKRDDAKRDDTKRDDSVDFQAQLDRVKAMIPKDMNDQDYNAMADAQARADEVFADFGKHAPRPLQGETVGGYERRCVRMLKEHSPTWKAAEVTSAFADEASFGIVRDQVYREARATAHSPVNIPAGELRMIEKRRDGHIIREFVGDPRSWMNPLAGATQLRAEGGWIGLPGNPRN
jgi:8-oxo-dGTP pyrophosphatase MutT (NUDIX family)